MDEIQKYPQMVYQGGSVEKTLIVGNDEELAAALEQGYTEAPGEPSVPPAPAPAKPAGKKAEPKA